MKTISKQTIGSSYPLDHIYYPFMNPFIHQFYIFSQKPVDFQFSTATTDLDEEDSKKQSKPEEYNSNYRPVIILKKEKIIRKKGRKLIVGFSEEKCKVSTKKLVQKDSRNVISNLLRIFLKNLLEVRLYDRVIENSLKSLHTSISLQVFINWVLSFGINFKNYIRINEVKRLFEERKHCGRVMGIILTHFLDNYGVSHCLTSKRIQKDGWRMHLQGIRDLGTQMRKWLTQ